MIALNDGGRRSSAHLWNKIKDHAPGRAALLLSEVRLRDAAVERKAWSKDAGIELAKGCPTGQGQSDVWSQVMGFDSSSFYIYSDDAIGWKKI